MIDKETRQRWSREDRIRHSAKAIEGVFARRRCPTCGERFKITGNPGPYICPDPWHGLSEGKSAAVGATKADAVPAAPRTESDCTCATVGGYDHEGHRVPQTWRDPNCSVHGDKEPELGTNERVALYEKIGEQRDRAEAAEADAEEHLRRQVAAEAKLERAERDWEGYEAKLQAAEAWKVGALKRMEVDQARAEAAEDDLARAERERDATGAKRLEAEAKLEAVREWAEAASKREPFTGPYNPDTYNHGIKSAGNFVLSLLAQEESE